MDRFKFRAWNKKEKCFIIDGFIYAYMNEKGIMGIDGIKTANYHYFPKENYTLMQCTGLKDKNGKLIFEGDICAFDDRKNPKYDKYFCKDKGGRIIHYVEWDENGFKFNHCQFCETEYMEILGNIYENPELLTKKKEDER